MPSMWAGLKFSRELSGSQNVATLGIALNPEMIPDVNDHWHLRLLPLRPLPLGFAINTLLYAFIVWSLIGGPFVLHRFIRVKRGLCPACAYPRGESDVCSECGKPLPARMAVTT